MSGGERSKRDAGWKSWISRGRRPQSGGGEKSSSRVRYLQIQSSSDVGSKAVFDESVNASSAGGPRTLGLALRLPAEKASRLSRSPHSCPITRL